MNIKNILVAVDFSTHCEEALKLALFLVESFDAKLHLIHVFPATLALAPPYGPALPADFGMQIERGAVEHFEKWQRQFCPEGLPVESHVRRGKPSKLITEIAGELGIDLIVMGTRGATGLDHVLIGSVAERTVRLAPCPVMTTTGES